MPRTHSTTALKRLFRMREMFEAEQAVLAADYEHFTRPRSAAPIPDAPTRPNKAGIGRRNRSRRKTESGIGNYPPPFPAR